MWWFMAFSPPPYKSFCGEKGGRYPQEAPYFLSSPAAFLVDDFASYAYIYKHLKHHGAGLMLKSQAFCFVAERTTSESSSY